MIQSPYILADLPAPLHNPTGSIYAAEVHNVTKKRKKKRLELVIAMDGEGINIYDIKMSRLITSYSTSPQAIFTCRPCSIRYRFDLSEPARRTTYCSVKNLKTQIKCFTEEYGPASDEVAKNSTSVFDIKDSASPVVHLEALCEDWPDGSISGVSLLAIHEDGGIKMMSQDLKLEKWTYKVSNGPSPRISALKLKVEHAFVLSLEQAKRGLLRNREDILATLGIGAKTTATRPIESHLLFLVERAYGSDETEQEILSFRLLHIGQSKQSLNAGSASSRQPVKEVLSISLPEPDDVQCQSGKPNFTFHPTTGTLYQHKGNVLAIYNLTTSAPRLQHCIRTSLDELSSFTRLSKSTIATVCSSYISVVDVRYQSVLDKFSWERLDAHLGALLQPQMSAGHCLDGASVVSHFSQINTIVAIRGRTLVASQINDTTGSGNRKRKLGGHLVDSIGRGTRIKAASDLKAPLQKQLPSSCTQGLNIVCMTSDEQWEETKNKLNVYRTQGKVKEFEQLMASELSISLDAPTIAKQEELSGKLEHSINFERDKIFYLLCAIFTINRDWDQGIEDCKSCLAKLNIEFFPTKLFRWLVSTGNISTKLIETALKHHGDCPPQGLLNSNALLYSVIIFDPGLDMLHMILKSPCPLAIYELVHTLPLIIKILQTSKESLREKLITNYTYLPQDGSDDLIQANRCATSPETELLFLGLPDTCTVYTVFRAMLARLYAFNEFDIHFAFRRILKREDMMCLIRLLRMDLVRSGWLLRSEDFDEPAAATLGMTKNQLPIIAKTLNCLIDAIGTGGWVIGNAGSAESMENEDDIAYMKAEIAAVLEGIQEATFLKGLLGEMLLFDKSARACPRNLTALNLSRSRKPKPVIIPFDRKQEGILPLGLKVPRSISPTRVGPGGEVQRRSRRDIGRHKSKTVGKYSFDRIVL